MPTTYPARVDHKPLAWAAEGDRIEGYLRKHDMQVIESLQPAGAQPVDADDVAPILESIRFILIRFAAQCAAVPLRSPNQLKSTIRLAARDPARFIREYENFDPEATLLVIRQFARLSAMHRKAVEEFETGVLSALDLDAVREAATRALGELHKVSRHGRTQDHLQKELAVALGRYFASHNGGITRIVHDVESGRFLDFLDLLLPVVRPHATSAGSSLTAQTMVRVAQEALAGGIFTKPRPPTSKKKGRVRAHGPMAA